MPHGAVSDFSGMLGFLLYFQYIFKNRTTKPSRIQVLFSLCPFAGMEFRKYVLSRDMEFEVLSW